MSRQIDTSSMTIAGVEFVTHSLNDDTLAGWALVTAVGLPSAITAGYFDTDFVELVRGLSPSKEFGTVSRWALLAPEFGWPISASSCGCLGDHRLSDSARKLNGSALFRTPGTVFDHFLIRIELLDSAAGRHTVDSHISADCWLEVVGLENSWVASGHVETSARSTQLRESLLRPNSNWLYDTYARALATYTNDGSAHAAGEELRRAFMRDRLTEYGYTYESRGTLGVVERKVLALNSIRLVESVCCTRVERIGRPLFATEMERLAHRSNVEPIVLTE